MSYSTKHRVGATIAATIAAGVTQTRHEIGLISGQHRDITAVLADNTGHDGLGFDSTAGSPDDQWYVGNVFDENDRYIDSLAIGGAIDADHAQHVAKSQLLLMGGSYCTLLKQHDPVVTSSEPTLWSITAINRLLSNPSQDKYYLPVITAPELQKETARLTFDSVQWSLDDKLLSHDGKDAKLYFELARLDSTDDLLTQFDALDEMAKLAVEGVETELSFDALIETESRLSRLKERLKIALDSASTKDFYVKSVVETKPFKRGGVINIAFIFSLSDGQDLSIWFHSPNDKKVQKLLPSDSMVSWKWMLNNKDVTAILQPANGGEGVALGSLAKRMMKVANQNSNAFKRAKTRAANQAREIKELEGTVESLDAEIVSLDAEILSLNEKIAAAMTLPAAENDLPPVDVDAPAVSAANWWDSSPDNVSVYLIGRSRKHSFVKITNTGTVFDVEISHNKMMKYKTGTLDEVQAFIDKTIKDDAGSVPKLSLAKGADVLDGADLPAGDVADWEDDAPEVEAIDADDDYEDAERDFFYEFMKRSTDKSYFLDFGYDDAEPDENGVYEIFRGYLAGKTVKYASTLFKIMDAVKSSGLTAQVSDFNGTLNQLSMFDNMNKSSLPVYGVTAQISNEDYSAIIRVSVDKSGDCEILLDEGGDKVFKKLEFNKANNVAKYKKAVDAAMKEQATLNDAKRQQTDESEAEMEANKAPVPVIDPVVEPVLIDEVPVVEQVAIVEPPPIVEPAAVIDPVIEPLATDDESKKDDLMREIQVMTEIIDSDDFDPTNFDASRITEMLSETDDDEVIESVSDLSIILQNRMVEISMAAMANMAAR